MAEESVEVALRIGKYELVRTLGSGGYGTVYEARDTSLFDKRVALKLLNVDNDAARSEMIEEIKRLCRFNDPFILATTDWGEFDGRIFMVTEFVEGETLKSLEDRLREKERVPEGTPVFDALFAASFGFEVARALMKVHLAGVVHKDLKPENVIVEIESGGSQRIRAVKLIDFGLAARSGVRHDKPAGTPSYVSPEVLQARPVSPNTDVYSLGCMLFEMVTGRAPYEGSIQEVIDQHGSAAPPPLMAVGSTEADEDFAQLVFTMMSKEPAARSTTTMRLVDQLGRVKAQLEAARTSIGRAPGPLLPAPTQKLPAAQAPSATTDEFGFAPSALEQTTQGSSRRPVVLVALVLLTIAGAFVASRLVPKTTSPADVPRSPSPESVPKPVAVAPLPPVVAPGLAPSDAGDELVPLAVTKANNPKPRPVEPKRAVIECESTPDWKRRMFGNLAALETYANAMPVMELTRESERVGKLIHDAVTPKDCARAIVEFEALKERAIK